MELNGWSGSHIRKSIESGSRKSSECNLSLHSDGDPELCAPTLVPSVKGDRRTVEKVHKIPISTKNGGNHTVKQAIVREIICIVGCVSRKQHHFDSTQQTVGTQTDELKE